MNYMNEKEFDNVLKQINKEKDLGKLVSEHEDFCMHFSCKPNRDEYPYPKKDTVIDEYKSVKWNREEVERQRAAFEKRVEELNKWKNILCNQYEVRMITLLAKDYGISYDESSKVWAYAYAKCHSSGVRNVMAVYGDVVDLYEDLLKIRENNKK